MTNELDVVATLRRLNDNYGRGDLQEVNFSGRVVTCKLQSGERRRYVFRFLYPKRGGLSVRLHGHQLKVQKGAYSVD